MGASVGNYFVIKTKAKKDFVKEEVSNSFCGDGFLGRAENHPLSKPMANHNQKGVKACREGKVSDEIAGDLLEGADGSQAKRGEGWNSWMCVGFVLLENRTSFDILAYKRCKTRPPKLGGNQLMGF